MWRANDLGTEFRIMFRLAVALGAIGAVTLLTGAVLGIVWLAKTIFGG